MEVSIEHPPNLQSHKWFFTAIRYSIQLLVMHLSVGSVTILLGYGNVTRGVQLGEHSKLVVEDCFTWENQSEHNVLCKKAWTLVISKD